MRRRSEGEGEWVSVVGGTALKSYNPNTEGGEKLEKIKLPLLKELS